MSASAAPVPEGKTKDRSNAEPKNGLALMLKEYRYHHQNGLLSGIQKMR